MLNKEFGSGWFLFSLHHDRWGANTLCTLCFSCLVAEWNQTVIEVQRTDWMMAVYKATRTSCGRLNFQNCLRKYPVCWVRTRVNVTTSGPWKMWFPGWWSTDIWRRALWPGRSSRGRVQERLCERQTEVHEQDPLVSSWGFMVTQNVVQSMLTASSTYLFVR